MKTISDYLADAEAKPVLEAWLQAETDRRVVEALATHDAKNPRANDAAVKLAARLERLEAALSASKAASELKFYIFRRATETHIPYTLIEDIAFPDQAAVDKKLRALVEEYGRVTNAKANELLGNGFKPGGGLAPGSGPDIRSMSAQERVDFHNRDPQGAIAAAFKAGMGQR